MKSKTNKYEETQDPETGLIDIVPVEGSDFVVDEPLVRKLLLTILSSLKLSTWELCLSFAGPEEIRALNRDYRSKDYATDVLSFPQTEWVQPVLCELDQTPQPSEPLHSPILGDLVICLEKAQENADQIGQGLDRELCFLLVHGILHLCGHDHMEPEEEALMIGEQKKLMQLLSTETALWKDCVRKLS